jgi:hypothetical protein
VGKDADRPTDGAWHGELIETRMAFQGLYSAISPAECGHVLASVDGKIQRAQLYLMPSCAESFKSNKVTEVLRH